MFTNLNLNYQNLSINFSNFNIFNGCNIVLHALEIVIRDLEIVTHALGVAFYSFVARFFSKLPCRFFESVHPCIMQMIIPLYQFHCVCYFPRKEDVFTHKCLNFTWNDDVSYTPTKGLPTMKMMHFYWCWCYVYTI